jgi:nucleotide-binding universal stress UspA family protein
MKILLAADGSAYTTAAARYLARQAADLPQALEIHVLHVEPPLPYAGRARAVLGDAAIDKYRRDESDVALAVAERELRDAPAKCIYSWSVGDIAGIIAGYTREHGIDRVVLGSRGLGGVTGAVLGSISSRVLREVDVPVLIVPLEVASAKATPPQPAAAA